MRYQAARKLFANNCYLCRIYIDNEDEQPVDGEEDTGNTEYVVKNIEHGKIEACLVTVLTEVEEGELGQEHQEAPGPPSHEGEEHRLPAAVEMVLTRE